MQLALDVHIHICNKKACGENQALQYILISPYHLSQVFFFSIFKSAAKP